MRNNAGRVSGAEEPAESEPGEYRFADLPPPLLNHRDDVDGILTDRHHQAVRRYVKVGGGGRKYSGEYKGFFCNF